MAKVIWAPSAQKRLSQIGDYIAVEAPDRAVDFVTRFLDSTRNLDPFPLSGSICPEDPTCRQVIVDGYRVIYEATEEAANVLTIIAPGQDAISVLASVKPDKKSKKERRP